MRLFLVMIFLVYNSNAVDKIVDQVSIRHGRSRSKLLRAGKHGDDFYLVQNPTLDPTVENVSSVAETSTTEPTKSGGSRGIKYKTKNRRITVDGNNTWQYMDKSFMYMGDKALDKNDPSRGKKKLEEAAEEEDDDFGTPNPFAEDKLEEVREKILQETGGKSGKRLDIVTHFLRIVESSQHLLGENCTAGTDLNLGEGVVDRYAQERFRVEADVAVNRANMLTRLWKYSDPAVVSSEYLLHASVFSMVEFDDDIFAAGNCYDQYQYKDYWLFCPYAYRLPEGTILVKDLAVEYKYLSNTSEWFYIARKNAENVIRNYNQFSRGYNTYTYNESAHTERIPDEILSVRYEDGKWSKPYFDCGGGNIWMLTYTVPFFGYQNNTYFFKGTSGIDIDLRRVDIDQCPLPKGSTQLNIFAATDKCKKRTTECIPLSGLGFRRGSYKCVCKKGFYFPDTTAEKRYYNGSIIEEEYEKAFLQGVKSQYTVYSMFECLPCPEGCEQCEDDRPCVVSLNWVMRTVILVLSGVVICCLPFVVAFTWKYGNVKVVRAASPVLLRVIILGAFFIYLTTIVMYPRPNVYTCTARVWLREIGFSFTYGALMLKTWRISVIFRVRSAKAVKITDMNLLKRLGIIVAIFTVFLVIRTLVAPPYVIVGRTADDLKAYLCKTDWWDHSFSILEVIFLVWGIRLCIVVRKAPSEFNESRFISMAIYNEFLLSVFLNISMLFLQKPANPDLLYIIFFCHTQLTVTLLLALIFGSKAYMVFKGHDRSEESSGMMSKSQASKFLGKTRSEQDVHEEFLRLYTQLELLKEKNMRVGNRHLASKISAMQDAASKHDNEAADVQVKKNCKPNSMTTINEKFTPNNETLVEEDGEEEDQPVKEKTEKLKRQSVSFAQTETDPCSSEAVATRDSGTCIEEFIGETCSNPDASIELSSREEKTESPSSNRNGRLLKSGHARTHAIVINLDDKSHFTEEVTV
ncbi:metabotropic glycine receptor isoform X2 [Onthophagus taurus]|uniref:metabotropic glycine receptor isoform X2 n=1 Tax=Onthophagus taurus TaxID=166361 RepID=UPI000C20593E|nr:probable G-protein coupled receptor 158 isoform X2 [Onthophagus taurus]